MAKKLEKHLYRSAATKAQYIDMSTLKRRLQGIAQRLGLAKSLRKDEDSLDTINDSQENHNTQANHQSDRISSANSTQVGKNANLNGTSVVQVKESYNLHNDFSNQNAAAPPFSGKQPTPMVKLNTLQREGLANNGMAVSGNQKEEMVQQLESQQQHLQSLISQVGHSSGMAELIEMSRILGQQKQQLMNMQGWYISVAYGVDSIFVCVAPLQKQLTFYQSRSQLLLVPNISQHPPNAVDTPSSSFLCTSTMAMNTAPPLPGVTNLSAVSQAPRPLLPISGDVSDARSQREKVVRQQQQRLLLLRHASKCTAGPACKTKFCGKMVELWGHMKQCRDKNCQTAHCLSSRCVLHHYRICKAENRTASCEVCSTVLSQGKSVDSEKGSLDGQGKKVDLMEQLAIEQAEQEISDDASLMKAAENAHNVIYTPQESPGLARNTLQDQNQIQALLQQQTQQISATANLCNINTMFPFQSLQGNNITNQQFQQQQQQHSCNNHATQNLQQFSGINIPLSMQQQQKQQAIILQMQAHQQNFLMQLQNRNSYLNMQPSAGAHLSAATAAEEVSGVISPANIHQAPSPEHKETITLEVKSKVRRNSASTKRKSASGQDPAPRKAIKNAAGGKGKRALKQGKAKAEDVDESEKSDDGPLVFIAGAPQKQQDCTTRRNSEIVTEATQESLSLNVSSPICQTSTDGYIRSEKTSTPTFETPYKGDSSSVSDSELPGTSLMLNLSTEDIKRHIDSLNDSLNLSGRRIARKCLPILNKLINDQNGWIFKDPVDPVELGVPDYFDVVKHPMDLGLIKKRLDNGFYKDLSSFESDVKLVFDNCILYNGEESDVGLVACALKKQFLGEYQAMLKGER